MPHIRFRAVKENIVKDLSLEIITELAEMVKTSEDNFTFEFIPSTFFERGYKVESYPFIEVHWFPRSVEIKNKVAAFLDEKIRQVTFEKDIIIVFYELAKESYFENAKSF